MNQRIFPKLIAPNTYSCLSAPARADVIDGDWCNAAGRQMTIRGPEITTPGGKQARGDYTRHSFSYVVPAGEAGAGETVSIILRSACAPRCARRTVAGMAALHGKGELTQHFYHRRQQSRRVRAGPSPNMFNCCSVLVRRTGLDICITNFAEIGRTRGLSATYCCFNRATMRGLKK